jgi:hypothetical protein
MTYWVAQAWEKVYTEHKDAIITCFKAVGLSLTVDGSEDHLLKVRDCLNLTVGDWRITPEGTAENPAIVDNDGESTIEVNDNERGLLYTAQEVAEGIQIKEEDKNDVTTNSGVESEERFDPDEEGESDWDDAINGDKDIADENM